MVTTLNCLKIARVLKLAASCSPFASKAEISGASQKVCSGSFAIGLNRQYARPCPLLRCSPTWRGAGTKAAFNLVTDTGALVEPCPFIS